MKKNSLPKKTSFSTIQLTSILSISILFSFFLSPFYSLAQTTNISDLQTKIQEKNTSIQQLQKEIEQYKAQIDETGKKAQTLSNVVQSLNLTQKKLSKDLQVTGEQISATNYTIEQLNAQIALKEAAISRNKYALARTLRGINENESMPLIETLLTAKKVSAFWDEIDSMGKIKDATNRYVNDLNVLKADLEAKNQQTQTQKQKLTGLQNDLTGQKKVVEVTTQEQADLLAQTKNKQANYQKILDAKIALSAAFEQEMLDYQSQLNFSLNLNNLPHPGSGVLSWPVDKVFITQYFGHTAFADAHTVYNGHGHNGIDLRAAIGTPIKAADSGIVAGTGDTDIVCKGASYGRWVLITHNNGLSTLYGHLSSILVSKDQQVTRGDVIAYSGQTGYAIGPHLHFTVFATEAMRIMQLKSKVCPGTYTMPIGDLKSYLNPLSYL